MNKRSILLSLISLTLCSTVMAQDKIYKRDGDVIEGKVKEVSNKTISYQRADNPDGPVYVIERSSVDKISYQNGTEDMMEERRMGHGHDRMGKPDKTKYRNNIIAVAPLQASPDDGLGIGLSYERVLDRRGIISFYLPLTYHFKSNNNGDDLFMPSFGNDSRNTFYAMPGIKIYPTGSKGKVKYAIGPSVAIVKGETYQSNYIYNPNTGTYNTGGYKDRFSLGMMVNNSLNINPTAHLYIGLEMGIGVTYIHQIDVVDQGETGLLQFGFKLGWRL